MIFCILVLIYNFSQLIFSLHVSCVVKHMIFCILVLNYNFSQLTIYNVNFDKSKFVKHMIFCILVLNYNFSYLINLFIIYFMCCETYDFLYFSIKLYFLYLTIYNINKKFALRKLQFFMYKICKTCFSYFTLNYDFSQLTI